MNTKPTLDLLKEIIKNMETIFLYFMNIFILITAKDEIEL